MNGRDPIISTVALVPGDRVGIYEITAPIGEGGMGAVYRARDTQLSRDVALKVLPDRPGVDVCSICRGRARAQSLSRWSNGVASPATRGC